MSLLRKLLVGLTGLIAIAYLGVIAYAYWPRDPGAPATELAAPGDRFISADAGMIRYRLYGDSAQGTPELVLIHGFANNLQSFRNLAPLLAQNYRVVAVDLPGFGLSAKPADRQYYAYQSMADAVVSVAQKEGFENPIYVGHSLGGVIALRAGVTDPTTKGLILIEPGIYASDGLGKMSFVTMFPLPRLTALQFADRDFRYNMITRSYHNPSILSSAVVDELMLGTKTDDYLTGMSAMLSHFPSSDEEVALLSELRLPVLALWAIDKNELPENSIRLAKNLPHARTAYIEEAGHYLHEEQPEQTFAEINRSLNEWFPKSYEGVLP